MDDLISRRALLEFANNHIGGRIDCNDIARFPAVDAEPVRHGEWVDGDCSVCGYPIPTDDRIDAIFEEEVKYCYHCGTKMDGGKDTNAPTTDQEKTD